METALLLSLLLVMLLAHGTMPQQAPAAAAATQTEAPREDPAVTALARKIYSQMRNGKVDESLLTDEMNKALAPSVLAQTRPMFDQLGDPVKLTLESSAKSSGGVAWVYVATFATAQLHVRIYVTTDGKVGGYSLSL